jgi:hypothetical protein
VPASSSSVPERPPTGYGGAELITDAIGVLDALEIEPWADDVAELTDEERAERRKQDRELTE